MTLPPRFAGAAYSSADDGDLYGDVSARLRFSETLGIPGDWATVRQVHGSEVIKVRSAGDHGEADALWTTSPQLPLAVFTADCAGIVVGSADAVGVVHAGWRGARAGVLQKLVGTMAAEGHRLSRLAIGPTIGPCCFEVGEEVASQFPDDLALTTWGTPSVDLAGALLRSVDMDGAVDIWTAGTCTRHEARWFSHRRDGTQSRLVALGWIP